MAIKSAICPNLLRARFSNSRISPVRIPRFLKYSGEANHFVNYSNDESYSLRKPFCWAERSAKEGFWSTKIPKIISIMKTKKDIFEGFLFFQSFHQKYFRKIE